MKQVVLAIALILVSKPVLSAQYTSMFGFEYELPKGWTVLDSSLANKEDKALLQTLGANHIYQNKGYGDLLEKIKTGEVEYLLSDKATPSNFKNNLRIQLVKKTQTSNEKVSCPLIEQELKELYFRQIRMKECVTKQSNGISYLEYSFSRPLLGITSVQSDILIGPDMKLVLMGASDKRVGDILKKHQSYMVGVITKYYQNNPPPRLEKTSTEVGSEPVATDHKSVEVSGNIVEKQERLEQANVEKTAVEQNTVEQATIEQKSLTRDDTEIAERWEPSFLRPQVKKSDPPDTEVVPAEPRQTVQSVVLAPVEPVQAAMDMKPAQSDPLPIETEIDSEIESEDPVELEKLADAYEKGKGVRRDMGKSTALYLKAANLGSATAQNRYASILYQGLGVDKNQTEAKKWFLKAALQGHEQAGRNLFAIYNAEARSGNEDSRYALAQHYINGDGVPKDPFRGIALLEKAANHGHEPSRKDLHKIYSEGLHGVRKNPEMALKWSMGN